ncbi:hypothetical protein ACPZ19_50915 [Amycolatopsis lurida]
MWPNWSCTSTPTGAAVAFAAAKKAMNDMPTGDMDYGEQHWVTVYARTRLDDIVIRRAAS